MQRPAGGGCVWAQEFVLSSAAQPARCLGRCADRHSGVTVGSQWECGSDLLRVCPGRPLRGRKIPRRAGLGRWARHRTPGLGRGRPWRPAAGAGDGCPAAAASSPVYPRVRTAVLYPSRRTPRLCLLRSLILHHLAGSTFCLQPNDPPPSSSCQHPLSSTRSLPLQSFPSLPSCLPP